MAFVHDSVGTVAELRRLFAGMDGRDEAVAVHAMHEAATILRQHDLSFRKIVEHIEEWEPHLLLPSTVGMAIKKMDSTTLSEAESVFAVARSLMKSCGLTFERIFDASMQEPAEAGEIEPLRGTDQDAADEKMEQLNAERPVKIFLVAAALLFCLWLVEKIPGQTAQPPDSVVSDSAPPPSVPQEYSDSVPLPRPRPPDRHHMPRRAQADYGDYGDYRVSRLHDSPRRQQLECWRDRSIRGPCF